MHQTQYLLDYLFIRRIQTVEGWIHRGFLANKVEYFYAPLHVAFQST